MASEIIKSPITPDTTKSSGNSNTPNSGGKLIPHYLQASTGSCHDKCKYGTNHSFEKKARIPVRKRITTPPPARDHQNSVEVLVLTDGKKTASVKSKTSSDFTTVTGESSNQNKREVSPPSYTLEASLKQVESDAKESTLLAKRAGSLKPKPTTSKTVSSPSSSSGKKNDNSKNATESILLAKRANSLTPKSVTVKASAVASGGSSNGRDSDIKLHKKIGTSKVAEKKVVAYPMPSIRRVATLSAIKNMSPKIVQPLKKTRSVEPRQPKNENVQEKTLYVIDTETENITLMVVNNKTPDENALNFLENSNPDKNKNFVMVENKLDDRIISLESAENEGQTIQSTSSHEEDSLEESEYTDSEADESISEDDETLNMEQSETQQAEEHKRRHGKAKQVLSLDDDGNPVKLRFRRGKVVDLHSENNGPRRLRFRRGRTLGDHQNVKGKPQSRRFKKRAEVDGDITNPDSEKVVLKHQDVQGKKDAQGLFNNVIEETASKLAQTRSSKVKALVGAFETVISLQDSKPA